MLVSCVLFLLRLFFKSPQVLGTRAGVFFFSSFFLFFFGKFCAISAEREAHMCTITVLLAIGAACLCLSLVFPIRRSWGLWVGWRDGLDFWCCCGVVRVRGGKGGVDCGVCFSWASWAGMIVMKVVYGRMGSFEMIKGGSVESEFWCACSH